MTRKHFRPWKPPAFRHHRHLCLLSERSQMIQFFIQPAHTLSACDPFSETEQRFNDNAVCP
jgi:hypothetical protein